jgi:hypothetical protein
LAIVARSFRLVTARLFPRSARGKQALFLAILILAGCGGSGQSNRRWQTVTRQGVHFRAPADWTVTVANGRTTAKDGASFVQVATFPLVHPYTASLFARVESELAIRMAEVAKRDGGTVRGHRVVVVDGDKSHSYDVALRDRTDRYTFLLRGKREFLLVCSADAAVCDELAASFSPA